MDPNCIFCKIVSGEIPAHKIYEDEHTLAFLDINPINPGHTLVIPKQHISCIHQLDDETYQSVMTSAKKVMTAIYKTLSPTRIGMIVEGFDVDHAHIKVTPLNKPADIHTTHSTVETDEEFSEMAELLKSHLSNRAL